MTGRIREAVAVLRGQARALALRDDAMVLGFTYEGELYGGLVEGDYSEGTLDDAFRGAAVVATMVANGGLPDPRTVERARVEVGS